MQQVAYRGGVTVITDVVFYFFFLAEDGIRDLYVTGVQTCALPISCGGACISYNDPHVPALPRMRHHKLRLDSQPLTEDFLAAQDCLVIVTDHSAYDFERSEERRVGKSVDLGGGRMSQNNKVVWRST